MRKVISEMNASCASNYISTVFIIILPSNMSQRIPIRYHDYSQITWIDQWWEPFWQLYSLDTCGYDLNQLLPIGSRAAVIYSRLFKHTQQHTACFTKNNWAPHPVRPALTYRLTCSIKLPWVAHGKDEWPEIRLIEKKMENKNC